jgi:hypothetical protein
LKSQPFKNKHYADEYSSDDDISIINKATSKLSKGILEIINDDDEEKMRTSSNDIQVNEEVFRFLRRNDLEFLVEYFTGEHCKTNLR